MPSATSCSCRVPVAPVTTVRPVHSISARRFHRPCRSRQHRSHSISTGDPRRAGCSCGSGRTVITVITVTAIYCRLHPVLLWDQSAPSAPSAPSVTGYACVSLITLGTCGYQSAPVGPVAPSGTSLRQSAPSIPSAPSAPSGAATATTTAASNTRHHRHGFVNLEARRGRGICPIPRVVRP